MKMMNDYIFTSDKIIFKHKISEDLSHNAYSMHTHNAYELIFFVDGDASHVIEDRKYKLKKGDLILIRPLSYHFIQIEGKAKYERYNILFDPEQHGVKGIELIPDGLEVVNLEGNPLARIFFTDAICTGSAARRKLFSLSSLTCFPSFSIISTPF